MIYPLEMIKLRLGIAAGVAVMVLVGLGIVSIPDMVWFPIIQLAAFTLLLFVLSQNYKDITILDTISEHGWIGALTAAGVLVIFISFAKIFFGGNSSERFHGASTAIGRTPFKNPNPFCPPTLDFSDPVDTDTERQTPACIADSNKLTEEQQLDEIDIYLRDAQESIARVTDYLNVTRPDERWLSKKEMDDPNNRDIAKNFKL